jgi:hypothetical protein
MFGVGGGAGGPDDGRAPGEVLLYCDTCGFWHARARRPSVRTTRRRGISGSILYAALRTLFWSR